MGIPSYEGASTTYPTKVIDANGHGASLPVYTTYTVENGRKVMWVSLDTPGPGETPDVWMRIGDGLMTPRIVLPSNVTFTSQGKWQIDGKDVSDTRRILELARFWSSGDTTASGGSLGQPGMRYIVRTSDSSGRIDLRPQWAFAETPQESRIRRMTTADVMAESRVADPLRAIGRAAGLGAFVEPARFAISVISELLPMAARQGDNRKRASIGLPPIEMERRNIVRAKPELPSRPALPPHGAEKLAPIKMPAPPALTPVAPHGAEPLLPLAPAPAALPPHGAEPLEVSPAKKKVVPPHGAEPL
jgi:hypothetical protein